jgi:hypothetical protein
MVAGFSSRSGFLWDFSGMGDDGAIDGFVLESSEVSGVLVEALGPSGAGSNPLGTSFLLQRFQGLAELVPSNPPLEGTSWPRSTRIACCRRRQSSAARPRELRLYHANGSLRMRTRRHRPLSNGADLLRRLRVPRLLRNRNQRSTCSALGAVGCTPRTFRLGHPSNWSRSRVSMGWSPSHMRK